MELNFYKKDLAYIHDRGFGDFALGAAPWILETLAAHGIRQGLVVDLGCGSGLWARELHNCGFQVQGVDISPAMLELARARVPAGQFEERSLWECTLPNCKAITALGECINYQADRSRAKAELSALFRSVHAALEPGGLFIFDCAEPGRGSNSPKNFRLQEDWAVLMEMEADTEKQNLQRKITSFRKVGDLFRRADEVHYLQLYPRQEARMMLEKAGFQTQIISGYGNKPFPPFLAGFVAKKIQELPSSS